MLLGIFRNTSSTKGLSVSTTFIVHFHTRPEFTTAFAATLPSVREQLPQVDGCIDVQVFRDEADPDRFCLIERWESKAQHETHMSNIVASGRWQQVLDQLAEPPRTSYFQEIGASQSATLPAPAAP